MLLLFSSLVSIHLTGGCQGNGNRYETKEFCEAACKSDGAGQRQLAMAGAGGNSNARPRRPGPLGSLVDICNLPMDVGQYAAFIIYYFVYSEQISYQPLYFFFLNQHLTFKALVFREKLKVSRSKAQAF